MSALIDLTGHRFGRLSVVGRALNVARQGASWECVCDCGTKAVRHTKELRNGTAKSCGCLRREVASANARSHGMTGTRTYRTWGNMWSRCTMPDHKDFHRYGGRGIRVCDEWASFDAFLREMGVAPDGLTLDRVNPDGDYTAKNCRWATPLEQARNKSLHNSKGLRVGVSWDPKSQRWRARITTGYAKRRTLGHFRDYDQAVAALDEAQAA